MSLGQVTCGVIATDPFAKDSNALAASLERALKSALLYCDVVEFANVGPALFPTSDDGQFAIMLRGAGVALGETVPGVSVSVPGKKLLRRPHVLLQERQLEPLGESAAMSQLLVTIESLASRGLIRDLGAALPVGTMLNMSVDTTQLGDAWMTPEVLIMMCWVGFYFEALQTPASFPFVEIGSALSAITVRGPRSAPAREADLLRSMLTGLPLFERATIAEIVDLREELRIPLQRFRAAMAEAASARDLTTAPVGGEVGTELWRREVQPALTEIDQQIEDNKYLRQLVGPSRSQRHRRRRSWARHRSVTTQRRCAGRVRRSGGGVAVRARGTRPMAREDKGTFCCFRGSCG